MKKLKLNFLPFINQNFDVEVYIKKIDGINNPDEGVFIQNIKLEGDAHSKCQVFFESTDGAQIYKPEVLVEHSIVSKFFFEKLRKKLSSDITIYKNSNIRNKKVYIKVGSHSRGFNCIWIEPYFHKGTRLWGLLFDYAFVVNNTNDESTFKTDREILIQSGTLNSKGESNLDYYLFKHNYYKRFLSNEFHMLNSIFENNLSNELLECEANTLDPKTYIFSNSNVSTSPYLGLSKYGPLEGIAKKVVFYFIYKSSDRDIAVSLLKGLRGETSPNTFGGIEKLFRIDFKKENITGASIPEFTYDEIEKQIEIIKGIDGITIPIIITNSKKNEDDEKLYYNLKHHFTNAKIPCQVVTKDLVKNEFSLKYSLSNIGLQIFAKAGGKPWKMRPATNEYLIIGIGQSYRREKRIDGDEVEKSITYSVLTDSSGLFKDIKVLGEGIANDDYYGQLVSNLVNIINSSGHKKISIHSPFRLSKEKILDKVLGAISSDIEFNVIIINPINDFFGFDYDNNGLVPFESTYIQIASKEFLVWFEGLQNSNPKISKRYGNPLLIKLGFTNRPDNFNDFSYKNKLLQDCINLSGANWRGFKAKQLPVSVFYCQRISEFISKFQTYNLEQIEIDNLNPWFL